MFINPKQSYTYFDANFTIRKSSKGWWTFKCPFCNELEEREKMAVNFNYGVVKCWICEYKDYVDRFVSEYEGVTVTEAKNILRNCKAASVDLDEVTVDKSEIVSEIELPIGYHSILELPDNLMANRARQYLTNRGFNLNELDRLGIGFCYHESDTIPEKEDYFGYIIIPFKSRGKLLYYIGRDYFGNFLRYKNPSKELIGIGKGDLLFNEDALNIYDECFLMEGWADAVTIGRAGLSSQGWSLSSLQKKKILKSNCESLCMIPDSGVDNLGISFYEKAVKASMDFINHKKIKVLDLREVEGGKDVNEIGKKRIMEIYENTDYLTLSSAMKILM